MAKSRAEIARDNLLEAVSKERAKSNPNKRVLKRLQGQLTRMGGRTSGGGSKATRTPAKNPDALRVADTPTSPDVRRVADRPTSPDVLRVAARPAKSPDVLRVADRPAKSPDVFIPAASRATPKARPTTSGATPKAKPRRPTVRGNMIGGTPPGGGTLSKKDVDEYSEAFASPDADKMYKLSEKNRRTDMNMLERAFDSIKVAGDRATADRKKRGLSNYDMNEDVFGSRLGGGIKNTMDNKEPSVRKRPAQRGFGVETRGN